MLTVLQNLLCFPTPLPLSMLFQEITLAVWSPINFSPNTEWSISVVSLFSFSCLHLVPKAKREPLYLLKSCPFLQSQIANLILLVCVICLYWFLLSTTFDSKTWGSSLQLLLSSTFSTHPSFLVSDLSELLALPLLLSSVHQSLLSLWLAGTCSLKDRQVGYDSLLTSSWVTIIWERMPLHCDTRHFSTETLYCGDAFRSTCYPKVLNTYQVIFFVPMLLGPHSGGILIYDPMVV